MTTSYRIKDEHLISNESGKLQAVLYETRSDQDGAWIKKESELYDSGNAAAVLLYDRQRACVLLNRQFRIATVYRDNPSGMMTEVCAGKIDDGSADETILREIREETGYVLTEAQFVFKLFMSPGRLMEQIHFYIAQYTPEQNTAEGGGLKEEGEEIETVEIPIDDAVAMIDRGEIIDAKTVILLQYAILKGIM